MVRLVEEVGIAEILRFTGEAGVLYERPPIRQGAAPGPPTWQVPDPWATRTGWDSL